MQCTNADVVDLTFAEVVVKFAEQLVSDRFREADYRVERLTKFVAHICQKSLTLRGWRFPPARLHFAA